MTETHKPPTWEDWNTLTDALLTIRDEIDKLHALAEARRIEAAEAEMKHDRA